MDFVIKFIKHDRLRSTWLGLLLLLTGFFCQAQCQWKTVFSDGFEYSTSTVVPGFIPGLYYGTAHPDSYAAHTGAQSVYVNFVDSNSITPPGTHAGTLFYSKTFSVCPGVPYRVSAWFCTTFAGVQCNLKIILKDGNGVILNSVNSLPCNYAPLWTSYSSGTVTTTSATMVLQFITNVGGAGGNDLGVDDMLIERCEPPGSTTQEFVCSNSPTLNLIGSVPNNPPNYGSWSGPSALQNGYLGTFDPSLNITGQYIYGHYLQNNTTCPLINDTVTVVISPSPTLTVNSQTICAGQQTATLTATGAASYSWIPAFSLSSSTDSTVTGFPSSTTIYTLTGTSGNCSSTQTATITVNATPSLSVNSASFCEGSSVVLSASGAASYTWAPASGLSSVNGQSVTAFPATSTAYTITGSSAAGCKSTATSIVTVKPAGHAVVTADTYTAATPGQTIVIIASGGNTYDWIGLNNTASSISIAAQSTVEYCAKVSQNGACPDTACVTIYADFHSSLNFPNVFTPNGDGDNDVFFMKGFNITAFNLIIFDRWGLKVFETSDADPKSGWNGTVNGQACPDGVYSYMLDARGIDNAAYRKAGSITLIR